jgi:hypothetical protein
MTVVRLADGGLFIHSPVSLDGALRAAVDALGPVTAIVAPRGELEQVLFAARLLENEVVFFHPGTRTTICADAVFNLATHPSRWTRLVARLLGNRGPGATWVERFLVRDRKAARAQVDRMLPWDIERIVLAHGAIVERGGREVLRRAYAWL